MGKGAPQPWNWRSPPFRQFFGLPREAVMAVAKTAESKRPPPLDFPGYAQEFLRRSPEYVRDYEGVMSERPADPASRAGMARRERTRDVAGKSGSVRVDFGGGRSHK